ncbi:hypothetical protein GO491_08355 [Flavobacteriaceae bacterium Ap0902]|nr:hypothetical protein [Flavobacteriaceae bacterium Ap0902]
MRKSITLFFLTLLTLNCAAQTVEKKSPHTYQLGNAYDSINEVLNETTGNLSTEDYQLLKNHLSNISTENIDFNKSIIINYINNDPKSAQTNYQVEWDIFYGDLAKKLSKIEQNHQFWMINPEVQNLHYYGNKIDWRTDKNNIIKKLFFDYNGLNGGFIIIKPDGSFYKNVGEYTKADVINAFKKFN